MTDEFLGESRQRTTVLSDDAWAGIARRSTIEGKSAGKLCEWLLVRYLSLDERPVYELPPLNRRQRSVHVHDVPWAEAKGLAVEQRRSLSEILEQLIRAYLGLELGRRKA